MQGVPGFPGEGLPGPKVSSRSYLFTETKLVLFFFLKFTLSQYTNVTADCCGDTEIIIRECSVNRIEYNRIQIRLLISLVGT